MCVLSMVMDSKTDDWFKRYYPQPGPSEIPSVTIPFGLPTDKLYPFPTQLELKEFYTLLERAREYDRRTGQKDCEMEEKKAKLSELAKLLGVEIKFEESGVAT